MEDTLSEEYKVYLAFRKLGYDKERALSLLSIIMEIIIYEELENM